MKKENGILNKDIIDELDLIEKDEIFETDNLNFEVEKQFYSDNSYDDIILSYLKEINSYPLLSLDEQNKLMQTINDCKDCKLLLYKDIGSYTTTILDIPLLFNSLCDNKLYKLIIDTFLSLYKKIDNSTDSDIINQLKKYKKISNSINRALTKEELLLYFNISEKSDIIDERSLLIETRKFISYQKSFNKMFLSNLRLVVYVAKKYKCNLELMDLINEGNMGLIKAIQRFDISLPFKFSTYAIWWIKCSIKRAISTQSSLIRIPENFSYDLLNFKKKLEQLSRSENMSLSINEISQKLSIPVENIRKYLIYMFNIISLDQPVKDDNSYNMFDLVGQDYDLENDVFRKLLKNDIKVLFNILTPNELKVIKMKYGLDEYQGCDNSIIDISLKMAISQVKVRQIQRIALDKLQRFAHINRSANSLKEYIR